MSRILLVEDDFNLGSTLKENLELEGYDVEWLLSGADASERFAKSKFDILVLDLMLPVIGGLELLEQLRSTSDVPVIMISAKGAASDRIAGLEKQADDYLPKPFHFRELLLRIQSLLRRAASDSSIPIEAEVIKIGLAEFNLKTLEAKDRTGTKELLTAKESGMLKYFLRHPNKVVSREEILSAVWQKGEVPSTRTIDNFVLKLRKLIEVDPGHPEFIISHRGLGYSLRLELKEKK